MRRARTKFEGAWPGSRMRAIPGWGHGSTRNRCVSLWGHSLYVGAIGERLAQSRQLCRSRSRRRATGSDMPVARIASSRRAERHRAAAFHGRPNRDELLAASGAERRYSKAYSSWDWFGATHVFGTCRMGRDPAHLGGRCRRPQSSLAQPVDHGRQRISIVRRRRGALRLPFRRWRCGRPSELAASEVFLQTRLFVQPNPRDRSGPSLSEGQPVAKLVSIYCQPLVWPIAFELFFDVFVMGLPRRLGAILSRTVEIPARRLPRGGVHAALSLCPCRIAPAAPTIGPRPIGHQLSERHQLSGWRSRGL